MDTTQIKNQFSKYIRKIILPKYEDIIDFEIVIKDDFGDKIGKGVYVYKLTVKSVTTGKSAEKYEKLVIL
jgi:hypothetical protein